MSIDPFIPNMMYHIFNCYKEHGWRIVIMHPLELNEEEYSEFFVLSPKELEWIKKEYKIIKDIQSFEEIPVDRYIMMVNRFVEELQR